MWFFGSPPTPEMMKEKLKAEKLSAIHKEFPFSTIGNQSRLACNEGSTLVNEHTDYHFAFADPMLMGKDEEYKKHHGWTERANFVQQSVAGKDFFDMGNGMRFPNKAYLKWLGSASVSRYLGIDMGGKDDFNIATSDDDKNLELYNLRVEFLNFLKSLSANHGGTFLFCGVQQFGSSEYTDKLYAELFRVTKPGDLIIITIASISDQVENDTIVDKTGKVIFRRKKFNDEGSNDNQLFVFVRE